MADTVRKHFVLPRALAEEFERVAGERNQSQTVAGLLERWLKGQRLLAAAETLRAAYRPEDHPEWTTDEDVNRWVRDLRAGWESAPSELVLREEADRGPDQE